MRVERLRFHAGAQPRIWHQRAGIRDRTTDLGRGWRRRWRTPVGAGKAGYQPSLRSRSTLPFREEIECRAQRTRAAVAVEAQRKANCFRVGAVLDDGKAECDCSVTGASTDR